MIRLRDSAANVLRTFGTPPPDRRAAKSRLLPRGPAERKYPVGQQVTAIITIPETARRPLGDRPSLAHGLPFSVDNFSDAARRHPRIFASCRERQRLDVGRDCRHVGAQNFDVAPNCFTAEATVVGLCDCGCAVPRGTSAHVASAILDRLPVDQTRPPRVLDGGVLCKADGQGGSSKANRYLTWVNQPPIF